jgi:hypothetical protein
VVIVDGYFSPSIIEPVSFYKHKQDFYLPMEIFLVSPSVFNEAPDVVTPSRYSRIFSERQHAKQTSLQGTWSKVNIVKYQLDVPERIELHNAVGT